jgi:predicted SnoaL-like aldol condensation-catalyzing enzyme
MFLVTRVAGRGGGNKKIQWSLSMKNARPTAGIAAVIVGALPLMCPVTLVRATELSEAARNKEVVLSFYRELDAAAAGGNPGEQFEKTNAKYRAPGYIQHGVHSTGPGAQGGMSPPPKMGPSKLLAIMADGDKVIQVTSRTIADQSGTPRETIIFNMFRLQGGKLVEHWDAFGIPANPESK